MVSLVWIFGLFSSSDIYTYHDACVENNAEDINGDTDDGSGDDIDGGLRSTSQFYDQHIQTFPAKVV